MSLIVVLLLLMIVSILGVGAAQISLLGERSARNDRDSQVAWQSAEAALVDAENDIRSSSRSAKFGYGSAVVNVNDFAVGCSTATDTQGLCALQLNASGLPAWLSVDFTETSASAPTVKFGTFSGNNYSYPAGTRGIRPSKPPRYVVELVPDTGVSRDMSIPPTQYAFRVTAMGFGPRDDIQSVLQMIYRN
jgi:type IV pilus assembly protein PilX